jgi:hypothetical protein
MALTDVHSPGATPLRPEDLRGLKLLHITTYAELNEAEAANIIAGQEWALRARLRSLASHCSNHAHRPLSVVPIRAESPAAVRRSRAAIR